MSMHAISCRFWVWIVLFFLAAVPVQAQQTQVRVRVFWRITGINVHPATPPPVIRNIVLATNPPVADDDKPPINISMLFTSEATNGTFSVNMATNTADLPTDQARTIYSGDFDATLTNVVSFSMGYSLDVSIPHVNAVELIPGGPFAMGNSYTGDWNASTWELPVHTVNVSAIWMDRSKKIRSEWDNVVEWATNNGYNLPKLTAPDWSDANLPALVTWSQAVQWCNARSEWDGLTPCYYTSSDKTTVLRAQDPRAISNACVLWYANGWRLPTEAEWEKAARGGLKGMRFPWGDTITHSNANYNSVYPSGVMPYDLGPYTGPDTNVAGYSSPWAGFTRNSYGLIDMAGNAGEWCWDFHSTDWYSQPGATVMDTRGPDAPWVEQVRVNRNARWDTSADRMRVSSRGYVYGENTPLGFRTVRQF